MSDCRVLIVGDDKVFRTVVRTLVSSCRMQCFTADDGIDALVKIHDIMPHVIVADVVKPSLWGFNLLPFIRRRFPGIGVIAVLSETERERFAENAAADVVFVGDDWIAAELLASVNNLYSRYPVRAVGKEVAGGMKPVRQDPIEVS